MANRDALWVDQSGKTIPVVVDEFGNRVDVPEPPAPEPEAPTEPEPAPKPRKKRG